MAKCKKDKYFVSVPMLTHAGNVYKKGDEISIMPEHLNGFLPFVSKQTPAICSGLSKSACVKCKPKKKNKKKKK